MESTVRGEASGTAQKRRLRCGFSTGTAATAAARAALRCILTGEKVQVVAVRLPADYFIPIPIKELWGDEGGEGLWASVIKDGGDDPDTTNGAELQVRVKLTLNRNGKGSGIPGGARPLEASAAGFAIADAAETPGTPAECPSGIRLIAGQGVGVATKPGLPVRVGEPAVNPVPREMLARNLTEELLRKFPSGGADIAGIHFPTPSTLSGAPHVLLPFSTEDARLQNIFLEVEIRVPRGDILARRTLNPRLGIVGGISILGTTGIVKPFSHKAYEETIDVALSVAASNGCEEIVLSTGGKSEHFARAALPGLQAEAFVQIADFFAYGVRKARDMGFRRIVHSVFFGKVVKMAQGHQYTHAHDVPMDLEPVARLADSFGHYGDAFSRSLAEANTARHALEYILARGATDVIGAVARQALEQSARIAGEEMQVRLLLFDYDGTLLADIS